MREQMPNAHGRIEHRQGVSEYGPDGRLERERSRLHLLHDGDGGAALQPACDSEPRRGRVGDLVAPISKSVRGLMDDVAVDLDTYRSGETVSDRPLDSTVDAR